MSNNIIHEFYLKGHIKIYIFNNISKLRKFTKLQRTLKQTHLTTNGIAINLLLVLPQMKRMLKNNAIIIRIKEGKEETRMRNSTIYRTRKAR